MYVMIGRRQAMSVMRSPWTVFWFMVAVLVFVVIFVSLVGKPKDSSGGVGNSSRVGSGP